MAKSSSKKSSSPKTVKATLSSKEKPTRAKPAAKEPVALPAKAAPVKTPPVKAVPIKVKAKPALEKPRIQLNKPRRAEVEEVVEIPQAAAVPTNGRPRKNLAGITPRELEVFRDVILAKRREIVGDMSSMEREALRSSSGSNLSNLPLHMADMGTDNYEQEFTLGLMEKDRKLLRDLNDGLAKIQNGTFGICEGTGKPISKARLEAQPWARYSIEYARKLERHLR